MRITNKQFLQPRVGPVQCLRPLAITLLFKQQAVQRTTNRHSLDADAQTRIGSSVGGT